MNLRKLGSMLFLWPMLILLEGCGGEGDTTATQQRTIFSTDDGGNAEGFTGWRSFTFSNQSSSGPLSPCKIISVSVLMDPWVVPAPFVPLTIQGRAPATVAVLDCPAGVNGAQPTPTIWSEIFLPIESPDGTPGSHSYQLSLLSNNFNIQLRLGVMGFGIFGQLVPHITLTSSGSGQIHYEGNVPWIVSNYAISATISEAVPVLDHQIFKTWHKGAFGIIRLVFDATNLRVGSGTGTLTTTQGSPMAHWLDTAQVTSDAGILAIDVNATVDLCGASVQACPSL